MEKISIYQLIAEEDQTLRFSGAYTKYFPSSPYCAIFEDYPAQHTHVLVCKKVEDGQTGYGLHRCRLLTYQDRASPIELGTYVVIREVSSEEEAVKVVNANLRGQEELLKIFKGH